MREDDFGAWWLAPRTGLLRLEPGELERAMADSGHSLRYRTFDRLDGMPGAIGITKLPVLARAMDGRIWVGADEGVAYIDPGSVIRTDLPLHVMVESARIDGREVPVMPMAPIPAGPRNIEIDYTATALSVAERIQFRYRLDGVDTTWREVGTRRRAYYTDLRPGSYHFRVSANDGSGQWNEAGASWSFQVLPAWYQTLWFRALVILTIGSFGGLIVWLLQRGRHALAQAALKHDYEVTLAERARIADDLHDTLLQGFTGVSLQLVKAENVLPGQPEVAAETIMRVQQLAQESLREARERVWEMRETVAASEDLAAALETIARDRTAGMPIEVIVSSAGSPRRLSRSVGDAAFRIGREAIVNAVRHAEARRLEIQLDFRAGILFLEVRDDGRGLTADGVAEAGKRGHFGIRGMRERAGGLGGRCEVRTGPEGGTAVVLELPITQ
jgi:signal transduction histidine kinase